MTPPRPPADLDALREGLLEHARRIVARDGVAGLTMRALATEAGSAVGLSYKAFASRDDLLAQLAGRAIDELSAQLDEWAATPGGRVEDRLREFAELVLSSDAPSIVAQLPGGTGAEGPLREAFDRGSAREWDRLLADFLAERRAAGELAPDVDPEAYAFLIAGALHNLIASGGAWRRPDRAVIERHLAAVAGHLAADRSAVGDTARG
ncbi:TetR/AcrR family transcriptional regulator [Agromyces aurantiacus]|uniref:TetR/AcrR family transcriptional regulator n=1 Tax=Agromyces aurantiacus TaxID=165814 RepID=A0ABV9R6I6_9MICO|nr:TetR/AcrR family transcriptional regulator [Agromyces aurantiacus]MBM7503778.1 AcrR family transcriptional regulator [Agromyces aurantiacus]